jgi:crotonobetainyl-CoA:carnitine CoA-transferase CaiB-like acyl-CoA transferase
MGARVIKIEELVGDPMRRPRILTFLGVSRGKEGIALNLKSEEGRAIAYDLVRRADVVHHNQRSSAARRLGIDYETLREINPNMVYCHSSGYGNDGPWGHLPTFEPLHSALTGLLSRTGGRGNPPDHYMTHMDYGCGLTSTAAVLAALVERQCSGQGQYLEVPQIGAGLLAMSDVRIEGGQVRETFGLDRDQSGHAPTNALYRTRDGWIMIACYSDREWRAVAGALELQSGSLPPFEAARRERMEDSDSAQQIESALAGLTTTEAERRLFGAGVPCQIPMPFWAEDAASDPLLREFGIIVDEHQQDAGLIHEVGHTIRFGNAKRQHTRPAPGLGEHTIALLREFGRSEADIESLIAQGVVGSSEVPASAR